jgi:hypothetical protein
MTNSGRSAFPVPTRAALPPRRSEGECREHSAIEPTELVDQTEYLVCGFSIATVLADGASRSGIFEAEPAASDADSITALARGRHLEETVDRQRAIAAIPLNQVPGTSAGLAVAGRSHTVGHVQAQTRCSIDGLYRVEPASLVDEVELLIVERAAGNRE